jgi:hypothetical protein
VAVGPHCSPFGHGHGHGHVYGCLSNSGTDPSLVSGQIGFVLAGVIAKLRLAFAATAKAIREALRPRPRSIVGGLATDVLRSRAELAVENVLLGADRSCRCRRYSGAWRPSS